LKKHLLLETMVEADVLEGIDHNENGDIQLPQSSDTPPRSRSSSESK